MIRRGNTHFLSEAPSKGLVSIFPSTTSFSCKLVPKGFKKRKPLAWGGSENCPFFFAGDVGGVQTSILSKRRKIIAVEILEEVHPISIPALIYYSQLGKEIKNQRDSRPA